MTIQTYQSRRPGQADPASTSIMSEEAQHMMIVNVARTVVRVLAPILVAGAQGPGGEIYMKILNDLVKRHLNSVTHSSTRRHNPYYRKTVVIRMGDLFYWGKPNPGSLWAEEAAA